MSGDVRPAGVGTMPVVQALRASAASRRRERMGAYGMRERLVYRTGSGKRGNGAQARHDVWTTGNRRTTLDASPTTTAMPAPTHVLEQMIRDLRFSNELPVDHLWRVLAPPIESVRRDCAADCGCDPGEMAITRNAS